MKWVLFFCAATATLPISFAMAAQANDDDIVILAVRPRDPDIKSIAASVTPSGQDAGKPQTAQPNVQVSRR